MIPLSSAHFLSALLLVLNLRQDVLRGIADGLQLDSDGAPQMVEAVFEDLTVRLVKLILHHVQILNRQSEQLALGLTLDGELPSKTVPVLDPIVDVELVVVHKATHNA